jgi:hypothetical protein
MAFKRSLMIEGRRLLSNRYEDWWSELDNWGHYCDPDCCSGLWRFHVKSGVRMKLDISRRKYHWLVKRYPKMMDVAGEQDADRYERTGQYNENWRQEMVKRFGS